MLLFNEGPTRVAEFCKTGGDRLHFRLHCAPDLLQCRSCPCTGLRMGLSPGNVCTGRVTEAPNIGLAPKIAGEGRGLGCRPNGAGGRGRGNRSSALFRRGLGRRESRSFAPHATCCKSGNRSSAAASRHIGFHLRPVHPHEPPQPDLRKVRRGIGSHRLKQASERVQELVRWKISIGRPRNSSSRGGRWRRHHGWFGDRGCSRGLGAGFAKWMCFLRWCPNWRGLTRGSGGAW